MVSDKKEWIFKKQLEFSDRAKRKQIKVKTRTSEYLEKRTWKLASKIGIMPSKVIVKNFKSQWGTATKSGIIRLNEKLLQTPNKIIDYIIIHELCHLKYYDHSSKFWDLVRKFCPLFERHKSWLEENFSLSLP